MLITDQVATAPCTDCVQARRPTLEAKSHEHKAMRSAVVKPGAHKENHHERRRSGVADNTR